MFCTILSFSFSLLHFFFGQPHSLSASLMDQHTILPANNTPTVPLLPPSCCLLAHAPFASTVFFFFCLFFCLATLNSTQVLQPSLCALSTSALFSILFILLHYPIWSIVDTHNPDLFCLTETWIKPTTTAAELLNCTPAHYSLISTPRNSSNKISSSGGGTAFLIREPFTQLPTSVPDFSSVESSSVSLQLSHSKISVFNICRPPSSSTHSKPFSVLRTLPTLMPHVWHPC